MDYNKEQILNNINSDYIGRDIIFLEETHSTNDAGKIYASNGCSSGTVVIAKKQTKGKGRLGRHWYSPSSGGIYMSLILRPDVALNKTFMLTFIAALSIKKAIKNVADLDTKIKWPNDIIIYDKKVCGILTELKLKSENIDYAVIGMGINVNNTEFNEGIKDVATSLKICYGENINRILLVTAILENYEKYYNMLLNEKEDDILKEYKKNCFTIGSYVKAAYKGEQIKGHAIDVDSHGNLVIKTEENELILISSGEATLKGLKGYLGC